MSDELLDYGDEIGALVNNSLANGLPILVAYVDREGVPQLSFRGSTHTHGKGELGFWSRKAEGGVVDAVVENPHVTLMYRDPASRTTLFFYGQAHKARRQINQDRLYNESPEQERNADPERKGTGIAIVLDSVRGRLPSGPVNITRP